MPRSTAKRPRGSKPGQWALQDAKARLSEVIRKAETDGPQHLTVHGEEKAVVVGAAEYRKLKGEPTGRAIVEAFARSPHKEIELEQPRHKGKVRAAVR